MNNNPSLFHLLYINNDNRYTCLKKALESKSTTLLYPSKTGLTSQQQVLRLSLSFIIAAPIQSLPLSSSIGKDDDSALIVLDGTWAQTRSMYSQNSFLHSLKQVLV